MTTPKPIARRKLSDGKSVQLWPDGQVTFALGYAIRGVGKARERWAQESDVKAGWAFMNDASLFDSKEAPAAIKAIRKAFQATYHGRPGFRGGEEQTFYRQEMMKAVGKLKRGRSDGALARALKGGR